MTQTILCFTPGLDSFLSNNILEQKGIEFKRVYCNLKSRYSENELQFLNIIYGTDYFDVINNLDISDMEKEDAHVPNRNLLIATIVQGKYDANKVLLSGVADDRVSDQGLNFYGRATALLSDVAGKDVVVTSTIGYKEKTEWCSDFNKNNKGDESLKLISNTYSCFDQGWYSETLPVYSYDALNNAFNMISEETVFGCMKCPACYRRMAAITGANLYVPFKNEDLVHVYPTKIDAKEYPNRHMASSNYLKFHMIGR